MNKGLEPLVGFKDKLVSLVHSTDLISGIILAGESNISAGQTYFLGSDRPYSWREIGDATKLILGKKAFRVAFPSHWCTLWQRRQAYYRHSVKSHQCSILKKGAIWCRIIGLLIPQKPNVISAMRRRLLFLKE